MGLDDFSKIQNDSVETVNDSDENGVDEFVLDDVEYYLLHLDELLVKLNESYYDYVNSKIKYDFKRNDYQVNTNWNDENNLRVANGLPKVTNQDQRNAIIDMKLSSLHKKMKSCEIQYKMYNKIFNFISDNFALLCKMYVSSNEIGVDGEN